jgi:hypothetical protein
LETAGRFPWKDAGLGWVISVGSFHGLLGSSSTAQGFEDHVLCWITTVIDDEEGFRSRAMAEEAINSPLTVSFVIVCFLEPSHLASFRQSSPFPLVTINYAPAAASVMVFRQYPPQFVHEAFLNSQPIRQCWLS